MDKDRRRSSFALKYLVTIISSTAAESGEQTFRRAFCASHLTLPSVIPVVTFPLDITKTRLQLQGQLGSKSSPYRGMFRTAIGIG